MPKMYRSYKCYVCARRAVEIKDERPTCSRACADILAGYLAAQSRQQRDAPRRAEDQSSGRALRLPLR